MLALHRAHDDDNDCMNSVCRLGLGGLQCSGRGTCTCGICECRRDSNVSFSYLTFSAFIEDLDSNTVHSLSRY